MGGGVSSNLGTAGIWLAALTLLGIFVRQLVPWRKAAFESEASFRNDLVRRVGKLERMLERERARHTAERALDRHRLNNVTACFDALLLLIETSPDRATEIVGRIKKMRADQQVAEAKEKAIIRAAEMEADKELQLEEAEAAREDPGQ